MDHADPPTLSHLLVPGFGALRQVAGLKVRRHPVLNTKPGTATCRLSLTNETFSDRI